MRRTAMTVVVAILLTGAGGCSDPLADRIEGSGQQPYSDEDPALEPAGEGLDATEAFVREVNRVCYTELGKVDGRSFTSIEVYAEWGAVLRAAIDEIVRTMTDLGAPPGDEDTVASIVEDLGEVSQFIASVSSPEGPSLGFEEATFRFSALERRMQGYGLINCDLP